eukprot:EG_transcript_39234
MKREAKPRVKRVEVIQMQCGSPEKHKTKQFTDCISCKFGGCPIGETWKYFHLPVHVTLWVLENACWCGGVVENGVMHSVKLHLPTFIHFVAPQLHASRRRQTAAKSRPAVVKGRMAFRRSRRFVFLREETVALPTNVLSCFLVCCGVSREI